MKNLIIIFSLLSCGICLAHEGSQPHYKPGADVVFSHNYDGKTEPGEIENLELRFTSYSQAEGELMKVSLSPATAFDIAEGLQFAVLPQNHTVHIPITLKALQAGRHYLGVHAEIIDARGHRSFRVFELPIQVGEITVKTTASRHKITQTAQGRKLVILESSEIVRQK